MNDAASDELANKIRCWTERSPRQALRSLITAANDEWAISVPIAELITSVVQETGRRSLLEFGAGQSSLILAMALQERDGGRLTSVEHQPHYSETAWQQLRELPSVDARMLTASIGLRLSKNGLLNEYLGVVDGLRARAPFDFVLVDGPPGSLGRDATLFAAAPYLAEGTLIIVDDTQRPAERTAVSRWMRALPVTRIFESGTVGRGVIVLRATRPSRPTFSVRTFLGTIHDRTQAVTIQHH